MAAWKWCLSRPSTWNMRSRTSSSIVRGLTRRHSPSPWLFMVFSSYFAKYEVDNSNYLGYQCFMLLQRLARFCYARRRYVLVAWLLGLVLVTGLEIGRA